MLRWQRSPIVLSELLHQLTFAYLTCMYLQFLPLSPYLKSIVSLATLSSLWVLPSLHSRYFLWQTWSISRPKLSEEWRCKWHFRITEQDLGSQYLYLHNFVIFKWQHFDTCNKLLIVSFGLSLIWFVGASYRFCSPDVILLAESLPVAHKARVGLVQQHLTLRTLQVEHFLWDTYYFLLLNASI